MAGKREAPSYAPIRAKSSRLPCDTRGGQDEDHHQCRLHAPGGASVHGAAGCRADAEGGDGGHRKADDGRDRALFAGVAVQGLAADRRNERRMAPGVFQAGEALTGKAEWWVVSVMAALVAAIHENTVLSTQGADQTYQLTMASEIAAAPRGWPAQGRP